MVFGGGLDIIGVDDKAGDGPAGDALNGVLEIGEESKEDEDEELEYECDGVWETVVVITGATPGV